MRHNGNFKLILCSVVLNEPIVRGVKNLCSKLDVTDFTFVSLMLKFVAYEYIQVLMCN